MTESQDLKQLMIGLPSQYGQQHLDNLVVIGTDLYMEFMKKHKGNFQIYVKNQHNRDIIGTDGKQKLHEFFKKWNDIKNIISCVQQSLSGSKSTVQHTQITKNGEQTTAQEKKPLELTIKNLKQQIDKITNEKETLLVECKEKDLIIAQEKEKLKNTTKELEEITKNNHLNKDTATVNLTLNINSNYNNSQEKCVTSATVGAIPNHISKPEQNKSDLESSVNKLTKDIGSDSENSSKRLQHLEQKLSQSEKQLEEAKNDLQKEKEKLSSELQDIKDKLAQSEKQLQETKNDFQKEKDKLSNELKDAKTAINNKDSELKQAKDKISQLQSEKETGNTIKQATNDLNPKLKTEIKTLKGENKLLDDKNKLIDQTLNHPEGTNEGHDEVKYLTKQVKDLTERLQHLEDKLAQSEKQLEEAKNDFQKEKDKLSSKLQDIKDKLAQSEKQLQEAKNDFQKETDKLSNEIKDAKTAEKNKDSELKQAIDKISQIQSKLESVNAAKQATDELNQKLKHEKKVLEDKNKLLDQTLNHLEGTTEGHDEVKYLTKQVKDLSERLATEMNAKVTSDESSLENISIQCRPMNVSDEYSNLCSNDWLDAKTYISDEKKFEEQKACVMLKDIMLISEQVAQKVLNEIYHLNEHFQQQPLKVYKTLVDGNSDQEKQRYKEIANKTTPIKLAVAFQNEIGDCFRQAVEKVDLELLFERTKDVLQTKHKYTEKDLSGKEVAKYLESVSKLAWKMVIQRPPMKFLTSGESAKYNSNQQELQWGSDPGGKNAKVKYYVHPILLHGEKLMLKGKVFVK